MQAESRASLEGSAHVGRSALFRENSLLQRHQGRDGSNAASLTDTTVGFIPSVKKGQPRRTDGRITGGRDGLRQRPRLSRCLCLPKTLLPSAGRRGDVPAGAQALPLGSVGVLPRYSWAAGTWCWRGTAERLLQGAELMPVSGARPAGCWFFPRHAMNSRASALRQLLYHPAKGQAPQRSTMRFWVGSVGTGTPVAQPSPVKAATARRPPQAMAGEEEEEVTLLRVFSYRRFPGGLEGRRRMGVEKHPSSHPVPLPPKPAGRASSSCLLLLFPTSSLCQYRCWL